MAVLGCISRMVSKSQAHRPMSKMNTSANDKNLRINIPPNKKCAAEAAHEKCSFILLRHSSFLIDRQCDKAYIFTQKVCLSSEILNCVAGTFYHGFTENATILFFGV